jgi:hypothetical protein
MERGSDKHGPGLDEAMKREVAGAIRGSHGTHAEEWKDPEPSAEDQPDVDLAPADTLTGATPPGMTSEDVNIRTEIAGYLGRGGYPADRSELLDRMTESNGPERLVDLLRRLPDRRFQNVQDVVSALGFHVEAGRF